MFHKILFSAGLVFVFAFASLNASAQCSANEQYFYNGSNCTVDVEVFYGNGCNTYGSVTASISSGAYACIAIPKGYVPVETIAHDPGSGQYASLYPGCGSPLTVTYEDCTGANRTMAYGSLWAVEIY